MIYNNLVCFNNYTYKLLDIVAKNTPRKMA